MLTTSFGSARNRSLLKVHGSSTAFSVSSSRLLFSYRRDDDVVEIDFEEKDFGHLNASPLATQGALDVYNKDIFYSLHLLEFDNEGIYIE